MNDNTLVTEAITLVMNGNTLVTEAKYFDMSFDYNELDTIDSKEVKCNSLQEPHVAEVKKVEVNISLSFILFDAVMATKLTKYGS